jgi:26S proteasome regulatory subunit N1
MLYWWYHTQEGTYMVRYIYQFLFCRLAAMLRQLAQFHAKDPNNLFMVRIAQGLTHLGKGTLTLCPYHSDRQLLSPVALAGLLSTLIGFLDVKNSKYCCML